MERIQLGVPTAADKLWALIDSAMLADRRRLRRALRAAAADRDLPGRRDDRRPRWTPQRVEAEIVASVERREKRAENLPKPAYPQDLPVVQRRAEIAAAIRDNQVVVLCGETGSGKTTQLPKICLEIGRGVAGMIGHTQPRRIAARSVAGRIASELGTPIGSGGAVGYKMRFTDKTSPDTLVKVMTDGILLAETQSDPLLEQYDTLIIDEAHERSLNIDFLLGYLRQLLPKRPELKLIITSATIDPQRFAEHFGAAGRPAPIIEVSGRTYPVEVHYLPPIADEEGEVDLVQSVLDAIDELSGMPRRTPGEERPSPAPAPPPGHHHERRRGKLDGDVLVFLSGEREIRETAEALRKHHPMGVEILPLYARLSNAEQQRVFDPHGARRIVLATNVAETSLTVPGIRYVVDPGFARMSRYSSRTKVQRLPIEPISRASADQRKGRCGRVAEGVCVRLYSEEDFLSRPEFTEPEILRTNLASVILQMKALRLGEVVDFPFVERPESRMIRDGYDTLHELGAVDERGALTRIGSELAHLPIDPRIGRMILAAATEGCLTEVLIIAAALSIQDPRERPLDKAEAADAAHKRFAEMQQEGEESDFLTYLHLWKFYQEASEHLSHSKLRKACTQNFLSATRMREWDEVHRQLHTIVAERGGAYKFNTRAASHDAVHRALLAGLLSNVGMKAEAHEYAGARNARFSIFPGSALFKKNPKWVMAAEIVQTTKMYARTVARVQPEWIERAAPHLIRRTFSEPHWDAPRARVNAFEKVMLFGLEIVPRRGVHFGPIDPVVSREMFIMHALVNGEYVTRAPFFEHNRQLLRDVQELEAKSRRRNLMGPPEKRQAFFEKRVPPGVFSGDLFEHWRKQAERENPKLLFMSMSDVLADDAPSIASKELFPDTIVLGGKKNESSELRVRAQYHLEPGHVDDGVTALVPLEAMNRVDAVRAEWLVPGMLREKLTALIRALPKTLRTSFVPAPQFADRAGELLDARLRDLDGAPPPLLRSLATALRDLTGLEVPIEAWRDAVLDTHLSMNFAVVDQQGRRLATGRDLEKVKRTVRGQLRAALAKAPHARFNREKITDWDFGDLPLEAEVRHAGLVMVGYPTVLEPEDARALHVRLRLLDTRDASRAAMHTGVRRLFMVQVHKEMEFILKTLPGMQRLAMLYAPLGRPERLRHELATFIADRAFLGDRVEIRTEKEFRRRLDPGWCKLSEVAHHAAAELGVVLKEYQPLAANLIGTEEGLTRHPTAWAESLFDMREQLQALVYPGFLSEVPSHWLGHYPRFLAAMKVRLAKLATTGPARDLKHLAEVTPLWRAYQVRSAINRENDVVSPELEQFRWMVEELRVSLFAQELRTSIPVSGKRLREFWAKSIGPALPE